MLIFAQPTGMTFLTGGIVAFAGELIRFWGVAFAGSLTRVTGSVGAPELIVAGPFGYFRNPLYVGNILLYVGIGGMSNALWPWLVLVTAIYFCVQYILIVSLEEEFLLKEFGAAYSEYRRNVPRFIPRGKRYEHFAQERQRPDWRAAMKSETRSLQAIALVLIVLVILWYRG